jgi:hypothetical protein
MRDIGIAPALAERQGNSSRCAQPADLQSLIANRGLGLRASKDVIGNRRARALSCDSCGGAVEPRGQ